MALDFRFDISRRVSGDQKGVKPYTNLMFLVAPNLMAAETKAGNPQNVALKAFSAVKARAKHALQAGILLVCG
jgi:hypothetical protein